MKIATFARPLSAGALTFTAATAMTSVAAMAACGASATLAGLGSLIGPPSLTATESSTDQALELIRKRREEASLSCPSGFTRAGGNCVPLGAAPVQVAAAAPAAAAAPPPVAVTTTTTTSAPPPAPASAAAPQAKRPAVSRPASTPQVAAAQPAPSAAYTGGSIKDGASLVMPGVIRSTGAWAELYWDHEVRSNTAPNRTVPAFTTDVPGNPTASIPSQRINQSRRTTSGGALAGADVSQFEIGEQIRGVQVGAFSGYNSTMSKLSDITVLDRGVGGGLASTSISSDRTEVNGAFVGLYGTIVRGGFSMDGAFKVDLFDVERTFTERFFFDPNCAAADIVDRTTVRTSSTTMTNYTFATNANYRFDMSRSFYIEPTAGLRWTISDFGGNAAALGLKDGDAFRVQGGLRFGTRWISPDGWIWNTSLAGLLYSDVAINGYSTGLPGPGGIAPISPRIDEGKLRVMGQLESRVDVGYGYTLYGTGEVRGGEDYIGFGARGGIRYQW